MEAELYYEDGFSSFLSSSSSSPSFGEYEQLRLYDTSVAGGGGECTSMMDIVGNGGTSSIPLVEGKATFQNLCINTAGTAYKIKYTLKDQHNISIGHVVGDAFNVTVGEAYQLGVIRQPAGVYGGILWEVMPIVAVQDRGYNTINSVNNGTVSIYLPCVCQ